MITPYETKGVRVTIGAYDFIISRKDEFFGEERLCCEAIEMARRNKCNLMTKEQLCIVLAHLNEINSCMKDIGGQDIFGRYWSSSLEKGRNGEYVYYGNFCECTVNYWNIKKRYANLEWEKIYKAKIRLIKNL